MYLISLLFFGIVNCKLYVIETKSRKHQKVKSLTSSATETGSDYTDSYRRKNRQNL